MDYAITKITQGLSFTVKTREQSPMVESDLKEISMKEKISDLDDHIKYMILDYITPLYFIANGCLYPDSLEGSELMSVVYYTSISFKLDVYMYEMNLYSFAEGYKIFSRYYLDCSSGTYFRLLHVANGPENRPIFKASSANGRIGIYIDDFRDAIEDKQVLLITKEESACYALELNTIEISAPVKDWYLYVLSVIIRPFVRVYYNRNTVYQNVIMCLHKLSRTDRCAWLMFIFLWFCKIGYDVKKNVVESIFMNPDEYRHHFELTKCTCSTSLDTFSKWNILLAPFYEDAAKIFFRVRIPCAGAIFGWIEFVSYLRLGVNVFHRIPALLTHTMSDFNPVYGFIMHVVLNFSVIWGEQVYTDGFDSVQYVMFNCTGTMIKDITPFLDFIREKVDIEMYRLMSSVVSLLLGLYEGRNIMSWAVHINNFVTNTIMSPVTLKLAFKTVKISVEELIMKYTHTTIELQSGIDFMRDATKNLASAIDSTLFRAIKGIILTVVAYGFCPSANITQVQKLFGASSAKTGFEFISEVLRNITDLLSNVSLFAQSGSFSALVFGKDNIVKMRERVQYLEDYEKMTFRGVPDKEGIKICDGFYETTLVDTFTDLQILKKSPTLTHKQKAELGQWDVLLRQIRIRRNEFNRDVRPFPIGVLLTSSPGVGKSTVINLILRTYCEVKGTIFKRSDVYAYDPNNKFMDDLTNEKYMYVVAEPGSTSKNISSKTGDPSVAPFLKLFDSSPMIAPMADLRDKGLIYVRPEIVVADTNNPDLNARETFFAPAAVFRRLLIVTICVRDEFKIPGTEQLDSERVINGGHDPMSVYLFTVTKRLAKSNTESMTTAMKNKEGRSMVAVDTGVFVRYMIDYCRDELTRQTAVMEMVKGLDIKKYLEIVPQSFGLRETGCRVFLKEKYDKLCAKFTWSDSFTEWYYLKKYVYQAKLQLLMYGCLFTLDSWFPTVYNWLCRRYVRDMIQTEAYRQQVMIDALERKKTVYPFSTTSVVMFLASICFINTTWNMFTKLSIQTQGSNISKMEEIEIKTEVQRLPVVRKDKALPWKNVDPSVCMIGNAKTNNPQEQVYKTIMSNVRYITIRLNDKNDSVSQYCIGLFGDCIFVNAHPFHGVKFPITFHCQTPGQETSKRTSVINECDVKKLSADLWLVRAYGNLFTSLKDYIYTGDIPYMGMKAVIDGEPTVVTKCADFETNVGGHVFKVTHAMEYVWQKNDFGKCGKPVIATYNGNTVLLGIHAAAAVDDPFFRSFGNRIPCVTGLFDNFGVLPIVYSQCSLRLPEGTLLTESFNNKHSFMYEETPGITCIGRVISDRSVSPGRSTLIHTSIFSDVKGLIGVSPFDEDGKEKFGAPNFGHAYVEEKGELVYKNCMNKFFRDVGVHKKGFDPIIARKAVEVFMNEVKRRLPSIEVHPMPLDNAVNGDPDNAYSYGMNMSTGAGYFDHCMKRKLISFIDLEWKDGAYRLNDLVQQRLAMNVEEYNNSRIAGEIVDAHRKDEARKREKVENCETRVFFGGSLSTLVLARMYLGPIFALMIQYSEAFCTSLGINCHSEDDVNDLIKRLRKHDLLFEGDYRGYDTSMSPVVKMAVNLFIYEFAKNGGYNEAALKIVQGLLCDSLYPVFHVDGMLFQACGFTPSGEYGTAERNSIAGVLLLIMGFMCLCPDRSPDDFFTYVEPVDYGDDVLASVHVDISDKFDAVKYAEWCTRVGLEFTSANKKDALKPFIRFESCSFLKRRFSFREDLKRWCMPLEMDSIMKTMCYTLPSKSIDEDEQLVQSCISSMRELFFHLKKDEYNNVRDRLIICLSTATKRSESLLSTLFPQFDQLERELQG